MTPSPLTVALVSVALLPVAVPVVVARCVWAGLYPDSPRQAAGLLADAVRDVVGRVGRVGRRVG